jgi:hypothetical protein
LDAQFLGQQQASVDRVDLTRQPEAPHYRLSGMLPKGDRVHAAQNDSGQLISPIKVEIPGGKFVPQYAPTVVGTHNVYDPAGDCNGNFMSSKFQVNNNCYNYACDVATNSFAQPGRKQGLLLDGSNFTPQQVSLGAQKDGLIEIATHALSNEELEAKSKELPPGHFVSLLFSSPDANVKWPGDYHWVRRDENGTWSQKDGTDQVTNFDYAGHPILDPAASNWTVNEGPMDSSNPADVVIKYKFYSIMFVPDGKVDII